MDTIARSKQLTGCDSLLPPEPCKTFRIEGSEYIPVEVDLNDYRLIGENLNYEFYVKRK
jgi:hypothetical protein